MQPRKIIHMNLDLKVSVYVYGKGALCYGGLPMFLHHPLYSTGWTSSDLFQFSFVNTVLFGRFTSIVINKLFQIARVYQKREENLDFTLHYDRSRAHPV